ncbi:MAG: hypothetical protein AB1451_00675 [Nitrospirota bacterium]
MSKTRSIYLRNVRRVSVAANVTLALALVAGMPTPALAIDCSAWSSVQGEDRDRAYEAAIDELLGSPKADRWTTLNKPRVKDCLLASRGRIQAEFDGLCAKGLQTAMGALDAKLYDYALGCVRG